MFLPCRDVAAMRNDVADCVCVQEVSLLLLEHAVRLRRGRGRRATAAAARRRSATVLARRRFGLWLRLLRFGQLPLANTKMKIAKPTQTTNQARTSVGLWTTKCCVC